MKISDHQVESDIVTQVMILEIILFVVQELSHKVSQYSKDKNKSEHQLFQLKLDYSKLQTKHEAVIEELKTSIQYSKHEEKMKALERLVFSNIVLTSLCSNFIFLVKHMWQRAFLKLNFNTFLWKFNSSVVLNSCLHFWTF